VDEALSIGTDTRHALALSNVKLRPDAPEGAREFEGYLIRMMLEQMRRTVTSGGLFDEESTRGYREILDDALAREMAARGGFGLADQLIRDWEERR
jgi:Rod binding domain-containing protein